MYRVSRFMNTVNHNIINHNHTINAPLFLPSLLTINNTYNNNKNILYRYQSTTTTTKHSSSSLSSAAPTKLNHENFAAAKEMVAKKKLGVGHITEYDQKKNETKINWVMFAMTNMENISVKVNKDWYVQGTGDNIIKFLDYLQAVPIKTRICNVDNGKWEDGKGSDAYVVICESSKYNVNTSASKIITDYIRERIYKDLKAVIPFIDAEDIVNKITGDKLKKNVDPMVKEAAKNLISRGYEKLEDFLPENMKEKKQTLDKYYTIITEGELNTNTRFIVQLTNYPPPIRKDIKSRSVYKFDKDEVYLKDVAEIVQKHIDKSKKQPLSKQMLDALKAIKDLDILK